VGGSICKLFCIEETLEVTSGARQCDTFPLGELAAKGELAAMSEVRAAVCHLRHLLKVNIVELIASHARLPNS
jgi:hypothetical protein